MGRTKNTVQIFYSWQSDLSRKTNLDAIRDALADACKRLEANNKTLKFVPDEATRDTSGSPNISLKILEKIETSAIFIADITTVTPLGAARPCPNPNVGYELGYAVATLGWDRIVLLFNSAIGNFPADLPFDFVQNRASPYQYALTDPLSKREKLSIFLEVAIKAVLDKNPKFPAELRGLTREKIEHDYDVENLRWLMKALHLPTLEDHIDNLPGVISEKAIWFFESFRGVVANRLFNVYDPVLKHSIDKLYHSWSVALSHDNQYHDTSSGKSHVFSNPGDMPLSRSQQGAWNEIDSSRRNMAEALTTMLDRIRADYIEINIHKTNAKAWKKYFEFIKDIESRLQMKAKSKNRKKDRKGNRQ